MLALYGAAAMVASYTGGWLCDRVSPVLVMKVSLALTGVSFLVLGQLRSRLGALLLSLVPVGLGIAIFLTELCPRMLPNRVPATSPVSLRNNTGRPGKGRTNWCWSA